MAGSSIVRAVLVAAFVLSGNMPARTEEPAAAADPVRVETGGPTGITVRLGEDIGRLMDDGATRRVIPVAGRGGVQNIADLLAGHGIDMAFVQLDVLDQARAQNLFPGLESKISYVARLNYVTFHLLARYDVASLAELAGKVVNVGPASGDTAITAARLFGLLHIAPIPNNDDPEMAIEKLRRGEIGAVAFVGGKRSPLLRLADTGRLHLVPVPLTPDVIAAYVPASLSAADYPRFVPRDAPVDTVAVATGLFVGPVVTGSDDYRKLAVVVDAFFTRFQTLLSPGHQESWNDVNLSSEIVGWQRFAPAGEWLERHAPVSADDDLRTEFMAFLDDQAKTSGGLKLSPEQKDALFDQFRHWRSGPGN